MIKLLAVGDGVAPTGLARATEGILRNLPRGAYEVHHLAINYKGDPHDLPWRVYSATAGGDVHGFGRVVKLVERLRPQVVLLVIDPWIEATHIELLKDLSERPKLVSLVLLESDGQDPAWFKDYAAVAKVVTLTSFARDLLLDSNPELTGKVEVIPLGVDRATFFALDGGPTAAKARLGLDPEGFVVLNANRNQARKRIDCTLNAFRLFAEGKPDNVKLYLHMGIRDSGWDVLKLAGRLGIDERLIISWSGDEMPDLSDRDLNLLYNACDVGVNTACMEGWGLPSFEHAAAGAAQIVPDIPTLRAIWSDSAVLAPTDRSFVYERTMFNARMINEARLADMLDELYQDLEYRSAVAERCRANALKAQYNWNSIGAEWDRLFRSLF